MMSLISHFPPFLVTIKVDTFESFINIKCGLSLVLLARFLFLFNNELIWSLIDQIYNEFLEIVVNIPTASAVK